MNGFARARWGVIGCLAGAMLLGGCATSPRTPGATLAGPAAAPASLGSVVSLPEDPRFAASGSILKGFDLASPDDRGDSRESWAPGDRVLLGLAFSNKGKETVRFLLIELRGKPAPSGAIKFTYNGGGEPVRFTSPTVLTRLRVFDGDGRELADTFGSFPVMFAGVGVYNGARFDLAHPDFDPAHPDPTRPLSREEIRAGFLGWSGMVAFSGTLGNGELFRGLVEPVVDKPNAIQFLLNPRFSMEPGLANPGAPVMWARADGGPRPAYRVPVALKAAGHVVTRVSLLAARCDAPLGLCGGIVRAEAVNPADPTCRIEARLLAAKRGG